MAINCGRCGEVVVWRRSNDIEDGATSNQLLAVDTVNPAMTIASTDTGIIEISADLSSR